jgi:multidrug efflux pump subunit AcrA (membrane-fusion protein)
MFARVALTAKTGEKALSIPISAVLSDGEKSRVIVADSQGAFRSRDVEVGPEHEGQVRVLGGLTAGEKIVVEGALFVKSELDKN